MSLLVYNLKPHERKKKERIFLSGRQRFRWHLPVGHYPYPHLSFHLLLLLSNTGFFCRSPWQSLTHIPVARRHGRGVKSTAVAIDAIQSFSGCSWGEAFLYLFYRHILLQKRFFVGLTFFLRRKWKMGFSFKLLWQVC